MIDLICTLLCYIGAGLFLTDGLKNYKRGEYSWASVNMILSAWLFFVGCVAVIKGASL